MRISGHAYSDQGPRSQNEDAHVLAPELGLFAVADGMGGTVGGEVASRLAIETLLRYHQDIARREGLACDAQGATDRMKDSVGMICREVGRACVGTLQDMGTTLAAIQVIGSTVVVAHVGDSRVYRFRDGSLAPLTHDHSFVNELESATGYISADTRAAYGHILTRHIGRTNEVGKPDLTHHEGQSGDYYLICTDGLTDVLGDEEIAATFLDVRGHQEICTRLVRDAWFAGAKDNITAVVVALEEDP